MGIIGSFKANRSLEDFREKELVAGVLAAEEILGLEGFSLGVRVGALEDAERCGVRAESVVGKDVYYLISQGGEHMDGLETQVFLTLDDIMKRLDGFHKGILGELYEGMMEGNPGRLKARAEKALILVDDRGYMEDLWKAINAEVYQDVCLRCIGDRDDLRKVHQMVFAGEEMVYGGFDGIGRATFDSLGYLADRVIAGKIAETQSAYQVIEYGGHICEVYVDNGDISDFQEEILGGTLMELPSDVVCPFDDYREYIDAQKAMILDDFNDIGLYEPDGSWGFYLTEKELVHIGLGEQLEKEKAEFVANEASREFYVNGSRVSWSEVWTSKGYQAYVYLDGVEIGVAKVGEKIVDGTFTGKPLYQFYPHNGAGSSYEADCCADAVKAYLREYFIVSLDKPIKIVSALDDMNEMVPSVAERLEKAIAKSEDIEILKMRSFLKKHEPHFATDEHLDGLSLDELRADFQECRKSVMESYRDVGDDWAQRREGLAAENLGFHG